MRLMKNTVSILLACCVLIAAMPVNALAVSTSDLSKRIIGVWGNDAAVSQDSMSSFANAYNTTFSTDGRVSQKGWRNQDAGTYRIVNENTVVATFSYNMFDSPGYGYELMKDYTYTVTYSYNEADDTLYADYSKEFEDAVSSNANDGTLHRISTYGTMSDWVPEIFPDWDTSYNTDKPSSWATEEVDAAREDGLIPEKLDVEYQTEITRAEYCSLVWTLQKTLLGEEPSELLDQHNADLLLDVFTDVDRFDEYAEQIASANRQGIVNGYGGSLFGPNDAITRAEAAAMLMRTARSLGMDEPNGTQMKFSDTSALQQWAKDSIDFISACTADGKAVMGGTGTNTFSPNDNYTREEAFITFERLYRCFDNREAVFSFDEAPIITAALNYANGHYNQLAVYNQFLQDAAQDYVDKGLVYVNGMWDVLDAIKNLTQLDIEGYAEVISQNDYNLIITQLMLSTDFYQGLTDVISENTMDKLNQIYAAICGENPEYNTLLGSIANCKSIDELLNSSEYQTLKHEVNKYDPPLLENLFSEVFGDVAGTVYDTVTASTDAAADAIEAGAILLAYQDASEDFYQMMLQFRSYIRSHYNTQDADTQNLLTAIDELIQGYIKSYNSDSFTKEFLSTFASGGAVKAINTLPGKFVELIPQVNALQKVAGISFNVGMWIDDVLFNSSETAYYGNLIPKIAAVASIADEFSEYYKWCFYDDRSAENAAMFEQSARMYYNLIALGHEAVIRYYDSRNIDSSAWIDSFNGLGKYDYNA